MFHSYVVKENGWNQTSTNTLGTLDTIHHEVDQIESYQKIFQHHQDLKLVFYNYMSSVNISNKCLTLILFKTNATLPNHH